MGRRRDQGDSRGRLPLRDQRRGQVWEEQVHQAPDAWAWWSLEETGKPAQEGGVSRSHPHPARAGQRCVTDAEDIRALQC